MRLAACRPRARTAPPPKSSAARSPEANTLAALATVSAGTTLGRVRGRGGHGPVEDSDHESAGRTSVATQPGGRLAAATASAASPPTSSDRAATRYHPETDRAMDAMSDSSGA